MNRCVHGKERLVSLLYGEGDPAELEDVRAHLATCSACRAELDELTAVRELLGAWPDPAHPPRTVYVVRPALPPKTRTGFRAFLPSLAAAAAVVALLAASTPFLRLHPGGDGTLRFAFRGPAVATDPPSRLLTRDDLDRGLRQTAEYLEEWVTSGREQERRALLAVLDRALDDRNTTLREDVARALDSAFDEIDRQRRADLSVVLASMDDLQVVTGAELERMNAILVSLAPGYNDEEE